MNDVAAFPFRIAATLPEEMDDVAAFSFRIAATAFLFRIAATAFSFRIAATPLLPRLSCQRYAAAANGIEARLFVYMMPRSRKAVLTAPVAGPARDVEALPRARYTL